MEMIRVSVNCMILTLSLNVRDANEPEVEESVFGDLLHYPIVVRP
jgi:hypothetical protein